MGNKFNDVKSTITVIGMGYIGLPTAVLLASSGYIVNGIDVNQKLLDVINHGRTPFDEPNLELLLHKAVTTNKLQVYNEIQRADIYFICVPTPFTVSEKRSEPDLSHVIEAVKGIIPLIKPGDSIIIESTVPVGTTYKIQDMLKQAGINEEVVKIAYCPERVIPGKIMTEIVSNDRIVGGINPESTKYIADFYRSFVSGKVFEAEAKVAEFCKLSENTFRDVNIAFANELSILCDQEGVNVLEVITLANRHPRVDIMQPGSGVGGHCIAVDPWFLVSGYPDSAKLIRTAREVNDQKAIWVFDKICSEIKFFEELNLRMPKVVCCGLTYKPDSDDVRESPALKITKNLIKIYEEIEICEPNLIEHKSVRLSPLKNAVLKADIVCILVKHKEFVDDSFVSVLRQKVVLDFCGATFKNP